ncbi:hypothetical protein EIN_022710 [Entamoeba invadens IP1]|uniref:hypothetical protein n=1 Tax=Entamoeba invadens IP1 TaxID=370355 RepID=UPI0002C3F3A4|nr:hypothetical protein EIN_022710 [Entamoeba invadens IP1]ELP90642.1 hypothetical protein EIN_022710 [Entamoeba invadens IP1]|eukprot:XP_004257413.1 hypothetical protein EIN_022710 [Entamoeba invadens IP1]
MGFTISAMRSVIEMAESIADAVNLSQVSKEWENAVNEVTDVTNYREGLFDLFKVFPSSERVQLCSDDIVTFDWEGNENLRFWSEIEKSKEIIMNGIPEGEGVAEIVLNKIVELNATLCYYDEVDFSSYKNLRKLRLDLNNESVDVASFFKNKKQNLDFLLLTNCTDLSLLGKLRSFPNIKKIAIVAGKNSELGTQGDYCLCVTPGPTEEDAECQVLCVKRDECGMEEVCESEEEEDTVFEESGELFLVGSPHEKVTQMCVLGQQ